MEDALVAVHPYESFVPEDFGRVLEQKSLDETYLIGSASINDGNLVCGGDITNRTIFYDNQGRGSFPQDLAHELDGADEVVFMGGKMSECVPRAVRTYLQKYSGEENLAVEVNSVYEPTDSGFASLAEIEEEGGEIPASFSEVGGVLDQYDWFS